MTVHDFMYGENRFSAKRWTGLIFGIFFSSGIFGFVYETLFYLINNGALTRRGTCFGPWIEIYGFGGLIIFISSYWFRKKPWLVCIVSGVVCGALEFIAGYVMFTVSGKRSWDYNTEIWNWGNIGGYICLRSVLVFAFAGLLLMYVVIPLLIRLSEKIGDTKFLVLMAIIGGLFAADVLYNNILSSAFSLPNAINFWGESGLYPIVTGYNG